uniref:Uncharacterized protein n=1 Tax=mine drainage metagenome TaxID=410659 RepID=E6QLW2_9ZZZZ
MPSLKSVLLESPVARIIVGVRLYAAAEHPTNVHIPIRFNQYGTGNIFWNKLNSNNATIQTIDFSKVKVTNRQLNPFPSHHNSFLFHTSQLRMIM